MAGEVLTLGRQATLNLMVHCGWKSAAKWPNDRLAEKMKQVKEILTPETDHPTDPEIAGTLIKVLAATEKGHSFLVVGEDTPTSAVKLEVKVETSAAVAAVTNEAVTATATAPGPEAAAGAAAPATVKKTRAKKGAAASTVVAETAPAVLALLSDADYVPQSKTTVEVLDGATVDDARRILGEKNVNNTTNRKFGAGLSRRYRNLMLTGGWDFGLRPHVIVDTDGKLQNTQHVLRGFIDAETERAKHPEKYPKCKGQIRLDLIVERGINPASANFIDIGKPRNHTDLIYRQRLFDMKFKDGVQQTMSRWMATAAKIVYLRCELGKRVRSPNKFEHAALVGVVDSSVGLVKSTEFIYGLDLAEGHLKCLKTLKVSAAYLVAGHFLASNSLRENGDAMREEEADTFFKKLAFGNDLTEDSPIFVLREWLLKNGGSKGNDKLNLVYDAIVRAWNAYIKGETVTAKALSTTVAWVEMGGLDSRPE